MGKKTEEELLQFGYELAKRLEQIEEEFDRNLWLEKIELRYGSMLVDLDSFTYCNHPEEAKKFVSPVEDFIEDEHEVRNLEELMDSKFYDGALLCDGCDLYQGLYLYEGWGEAAFWGRDATKKIYDTFLEVMEKHGFHMDMSRDGIFGLQCHESWEEENG